jgi:hypothetical protein
MCKHDHHTNTFHDDLANGERLFIRVRKRDTLARSLFGNHSYSSQDGACGIVAF